MNHQRMHRTLKRFAHGRFALSTVVTTLIILVISVLLASVVTYFAINVTSTRVQEESLALAKQHVWYDSSNQKAQAAIMVINAGGRDIVIDRLTVRGQECAWSKVLFFVTGDSISGDLFYNSTLIDGGSISIGGSSRVFKQASADLTLQSGKTLIIYMSNPDSISVNDIGLTVSVNIFTSQAMYYKETNVQGTSGTTSPASSSELEITYVAAHYYYDDIDNTYFSEVAMVLTNKGSTTVTITKDSLIVKGSTVASTYCTAGTVVNAVNDLPFLTNIDGPVQSTTLDLVDGLTIQAGTQVIIYFVNTVGSDDSNYIHIADIGTNISVGIDLGNGQSVTTTVNVNEVPHT